VIFQVPDHHLPQRRVIINDDDMTDIREHELISQFFSPLAVLSQFEFQPAIICHFPAVMSEPDYPYADRT